MTKNEFSDLMLQSIAPAEKMIGMVPADKIDWKPGPAFMTTGQLLAHLSDGVGVGLGMLVSGKWPSMEEMESGMKLENLPSCGAAEALSKLENDKKALRETLDGLSEEDFTNLMVSVPWGWKSKFEIMSVNFLGHFNNHKMQLFTYLKLLGVPVNTESLYGG
jgi:hypothetical protein